MLFSMPHEVQGAPATSVPFPSRLGRPEDDGKRVQQIVTNDRRNGEVVRLDGAIRMGPERCRRRVRSSICLCARSRRAASRAYGGFREFEQTRQDFIHGR